MGFSLILRAFFSFPNERQFIECQFFWEFRINGLQIISKRFLCKRFPNSTLVLSISLGSTLFIANTTAKIESGKIPN